MKAATVERIAGRLLFVRMGTYSVAFAMERIVGMLPSDFVVSRAGKVPWVFGRVRFLREDIPFISLGPKLGYEPPAQPKGGIVVSLGGIRIALEIAGVIGTSGDGEGEFHALPPCLSELPTRVLPGIAVAGMNEGFALEVDSLLTNEDIEAIGEALFS